VIIASAAANAEHLAAAEKYYAALVGIASGVVFVGPVDVD
jgi:hypothetical protein